MPRSRVWLQLTGLTKGGKRVGRRIRKSRTQSVQQEKEDDPLPAPSMFGHPNSPDFFSIISPVPDHEASLLYWKTKAKHYESKCADLGAQLGYLTHVTNNHIRAGRLENSVLATELGEALEENARLTTLLESLLIQEDMVSRMMGHLDVC